MWKKVGKKPNIQNKSTVSMVSQEAKGQLTARKSRNQTNSHANILITEKEVDSIKYNQNLGYSRSYLQLPYHSNHKAQPNKLQRSQHQELIEKCSEQERPTQTKNIGQINVELMNKLKKNIRSILKTVQEMKVNQQLMKNDFKDKVAKFKQLMAKIDNAVSQKPNHKVDQALQKIQNYRAKLNDFDKRRESILKNYGLVWSELL